MMGVQGACPLAGFGGAEPLHQCNWKLPRFRASSPDGAWGKAPENLFGGPGVSPGGVWRGRAPPPMQLAVAEVQGPVPLVGNGATPQKYLCAFRSSSLKGLKPRLPKARPLGLVIKQIL